MFLLSRYTFLGLQHSFILLDLRPKPAFFFACAKKEAKKHSNERRCITRKHAKLFLKSFISAVLNSNASKYGW